MFSSRQYYSIWLRRPWPPTHQSFADVDRLVKDCPHNCFRAVWGRQGARVPVELAEVYGSNQVTDRDVVMYRSRNVCGNVTECFVLKPTMGHCEIQTQEQNKCSI